MAIINIHFRANYFEGMEVICKLVGWEGLVTSKFYTDNEIEKVKKKFNNWVKSKKEMI